MGNVLKNNRNEYIFLKLKTEKLDWSAPDRPLSGALWITDSGDDMKKLQYERVFF